MTTRTHKRWPGRSDKDRTRTRTTAGEERQAESVRGRDFLPDRGCMDFDEDNEDNCRGGVLDKAGEEGETNVVIYNKEDDDLVLDATTNLAVRCISCRERGGEF